MTDKYSLKLPDVQPHLLVGVPARKFLQLALKCRYPGYIKLFIDISLILLAACWAWVVSFGQIPSPGSIWPFLLVVACCRLTIYLVLRLHRSSWIHVSRSDVLWLALSAVLAPPLIAIVLWLLPVPFTLGALTRPYIILTTEPAFYLLLMLAPRITIRAIASSEEQKNLKRVLVIGAGDAALALAFQIQERHSGYHIVGFLDDDPRKQKRRLRGIPVLGTRENLAEVAREHEVQEIIIAIPSLPPEELRLLLADCESIELPIRILPPLHEMMGRQPNMYALREIRMEDLLPRPEVQLDRAAISGYLRGRRVLVTGGGGSIGGELCRQALAAGATQLLVLGRGENSVFEITQELAELGKEHVPNAKLASLNHKDDPRLSKTQGACEIVPIICDVRDRAALQSVFDEYQPAVVFHAAAHKHVPLMEQHPGEAVKNNVLGTLNVVQLSVENKVERFVLVSTDKAVNPCNIMGATKRICEMIVKGYASMSQTTMVSVRFGNVLGSRGSVVPTMTRQIRQGGPITVTDPDMVRYFMTIPEAVQLILQAGAVGGSGDVFILEMGHPVRIFDLAHDLVRLSGLVPNQDIMIEIIGSRPGEKLKEELLTSQENAGAQKKGPFYVAPPQDVQISSLLTQVNRLIQAAEQNEEEQIPHIIQEIISEYHPQESTNGQSSGASLDIVQSSNGKHLPVEHCPDRLLLSEATNP